VKHAFGVRSMLPCGKLRKIIAQGENPSPPAGGVSPVIPESYQKITANGTAALIQIANNEPTAE